MPRFLVIQLFGPLASWGDIAVGEQRPSLPHPTKSAVLGLVAAALGYRRGNDGQHQQLHDRLQLAVRIDAFGGLLTDFHAAQAPSQAELRRARKKTTIATRADELLRVADLTTILSRRDYYMDAVALAAFGELEPGDPSLEKIAEALTAPNFALYLGRRSCSPALPLAPRIVEAASIVEALRAHSGDDQYQQVLKLLSSTRNVAVRTILWEGDVANTPPTTTLVRRDALLSRRRWQFTERHVHRIDEEVRDVSE